MMSSSRPFAGREHGEMDSAHEKLREPEIWRPAEENPILRRGPGGTWDSSSAVGFSLAVEDGRYRLWYEGRMPTGSDGRRQVRAQVGHAVSTDGRHWKKDPAPVLSVGRAESWDSEHVYSPDVRKTEDGYRLYYHGNATASGGCDIGLAFSDDGLRWERAPSNPVLRHGDRGEPDDLLVACPNVLQVDGGFAMVYCQAGSTGSGELWTIALAVSADGVRWEKLGSVIDLAQEERCISSPTIVRLGKTYYLWAWAFRPGAMETNAVRLFWSEDLRRWRAAWDSGWVGAWLPDGVNRQFFMPRVCGGAPGELWMMYPMRVERGISDTGLAVARIGE